MEQPGVQVRISVGVGPAHVGGLRIVAFVWFDFAKMAGRVTDGVLQRLRSLNQNRVILERMEEINRDLSEQCDLLLVVLIASLWTERSEGADRLANLPAKDCYPQNTSSTETDACEGYAGGIHFRMFGEVFLDGVINLDGLPVTSSQVQPQDSESAHGCDGIRVISALKRIYVRPGTVFFYPRLSFSPISPMPCKYTNSGSSAPAGATVAT